MKKLIKIELSEKDIKELVCEKFGIHPDTAVVRVSHWKGDMREPAYTSITIEGVERGPQLQFINRGF